MIAPILHRLVSIPLIYDWVQRIAGWGKVKNELIACIHYDGFLGSVLDVGGGTGLNKSILSPEIPYLCLDIDADKLCGFLKKYSRGRAVQADATQLPFAAASFDTVFCTAVFHHIDDRQLSLVLAELARVVRAGGKLIVQDPIWRSTCWPGRLLWRYDRGAFPRTPTELSERIQSIGKIAYWKEFSYLHAYMVAVVLIPPAHDAP